MFASALSLFGQTPVKDEAKTARRVSFLLPEVITDENGATEVESGFNQEKKLVSQLFVCVGGMISLTVGRLTVFCLDSIRM